MALASPMQNVLAGWFGAGKGSGLGVIFFLVGMVGAITSFWCLRNPTYKTLNED